MDLGCLHVLTLTVEEGVGDAETVMTVELK